VPDPRRRGGRERAVGGRSRDAGFRGATQPNRLIWLLYAGAVSLALGVTSLGIGLLMA
jgi:hypothetical protein